MFVFLFLMTILNIDLIQVFEYEGNNKQYTWYSQYVSCWYELEEADCQQLYFEGGIHYWHLRYSIH